MLTVDNWYHHNGAVGLAGADLRGDTTYFEVISSPSIYATQTVRTTIACEDETPPQIRFYIYYYDEKEILSRISGDWITLETTKMDIEWLVPDTGGRPVEGTDGEHFFRSPR